MATAADHIELANRNHQALLHLIADYPQFPEWISTVAFYKALQIVDALCRESRRATYGHEARLEILRRTKQWQPIYGHYRVLWQSSTVARYLYDNGAKVGDAKFTDYLAPADVVANLIGKRLVTIEQVALSLLQDSSLKQRLARIDPASLPTA